MKLPFAVNQFFEVFERYNHAVWPAQIILILLGCTAVALLFRPRAQSDVIISAILAALWGWLGVAYHWIFFARINPAAYLFAIACVLGALIFLWYGVIRRRLHFDRTVGWRLWAGGVLLLYSLLIYPLLSWQMGATYFASPTFGLPCPTTIFTIGALAFLRRPFPRAVWVVPILWSIVGGQAAFLLSVPQDLGLLGAGAIGSVLAWRNS